MNGFRPVDEDARTRTRADHATSLVLEAGAGTGKTTLLVERIEAMVRAGAARLDEIAAVTFTENAATTMKLRLRERLERARTDARTPARERERVSAALEVLERASVSTIHALCAQILQERPLECGVLPGFRMADEAQADALFAAAWEEWLGERLAGGDDVLLDALDRGIPLEGEGPWGERSSLRGLARTLVEQRDLAPIAAEGGFLPEAWRDELLAQAVRARALAQTAREGDTLAGRLLAVRGVRRALALPLGSEPRASSAGARGHPGELRPPGALAVVRGARGGPRHRRRGPKETREALGGRSRRGAARRAWCARCWRRGRALRARARPSRVSSTSWTCCCGPATRCATAGQCARLFARRFRTSIIDEFQDTDPLQVEIARLLTRGRPGGLVVVGDAKQSIYRFRRAEVRSVPRV